MYDDKFNDIFKKDKAFQVAKSDNIVNIPANDKFRTVSDNSNLDEYYVQHMKVPTYHFNSNSDNEILKHLGLPEIYLNEGREYANKYPKYSKGEEIIQRWQTEKGTDNAFNRQMRAEANDEKIEDIAQKDNDYNRGLEEVRKLIKSDYKRSKYHTTEAESVVQEVENEHKKAVKQIKPVKIENAFDKEKVVEDIKDKVKLKAKETVNKFLSNQAKAKQITAEQKEIKAKYLEGKRAEKLRELAKEMGKQKASQKINRFILTRSEAIKQEEEDLRKQQQQQEEEEEEEETSKKQVKESRKSGRKRIPDSELTPLQARNRRYRENKKAKEAASGKK